MGSWMDPNSKWHTIGVALIWVIGSFIFFRALQFVVRWYLFGKCTFRAFSYFGLKGRNRNSDSSRDLTVIPPNKKWRISNESVSLIHSVVSGLWAAYCLLFYKGLIDDLVNNRNQIALNLVYVSFGYLLHDFLDLVLNEQSARIIELLFHHFVVITGFVVTLVTYKYLGIVIFGLLMELNSVFLHTRSLMNLYGVKKKSTSFRLVALLNIITLAVFRISVSIYLVYWAIMQINVIPWVHVIFCIFVIFSLFCSNAVLTYRVMAADGLFGAARARKPPLPPITCSSADIESGDRNEVEADDEDEDGQHEVAVQTTEARVLVDDVTQTVA
ncbi:TLC domain-containing protein 2 [Trichostrongylus colubriformis]|uniref:TLC domain-containing protein 2 n=1 Tax=Trichostrongylus colubriformis TaxID=6319 RepID=A0AAN8GCA7_TRICO